MDNKTVFVKTSKGEAEASGQTSLLFGDVKRAFILINNKSTVDELRKHAAPSLREVLEEMLEQLERDDFIRDKNDTGQKKSSGSVVPKMSVPKMSMPKMSVPTQEEESATGAEMDEELDFTTIMQAPNQEVMAAEAARARAGNESKAQPGTADELDFSDLLPMPGQGAEDEAKAQAGAGKTEVAGELDFSSILQMPNQNPAADRAKAEAEARARAEMEAKMRAEAEARMRAEADAKAKLQAEWEAKARADAEAKARAEAEARMRAEAEAKARARAEMEAKIRAEAEVKARAEAEAKAKADAGTSAGAMELDFSSILQMPNPNADADKAKAEAETKARTEAEAKARMEVEARMRAEAEAKARVRAEMEAKVRAEAAAKARVRAELEAGMRTQADDARVASGKNHTARSMIATVLFFDVVGYTKQSVAKQIELKGQFNALISGFIGHVAEDQRIILDTGDGAAIGFLQHPEDALDVAMKFRAAVTANNHRDYPELKVRAGIHLGPVNVMKDMNDNLNMVGDGINDAQRIMSFAGIDQIYVSRSYFDVISRLTADSARLFKYNGTQKDKHGRDHQVYLVLGEGGSAPLPVNHQAGGLASLMSDLSSLMNESPGGGAARQVQPPAAAKPVQQSAGSSATARPAQELDFSQFKMNDTPEAPPAWQPMDLPQSAQGKSPQEIEMEARRAAKLKAEQAAEAARIRAQQEAAAVRTKAEQDAVMAQQEGAARKLAEEQAKAFAEAEKRAQEQAEIQAKAAAKQAKEQAKSEKERAKAQAKKAKELAKRAASSPRSARGRSGSGSSLSLGKFLASLVILALAAVIGLPYVWPMQDYIVQVEQELSAQLKQPVHIGSMSAATLPAPRLDLQNVTVGNGQELKVGHVALFFDALSLPANIRTIDKAELENVTVSAASFSGVMPWLQAMGGNARYPVARVTLHGVHVSGDVALPVFGGKIDFDAYGHFTKVRLSSDDGKLGIELQPQEKHLQLDVSLTDSPLPLLPNIQFGSLTASGDVNNGVINFTSIEGSLYGGTLKGSAYLAWQGGWQLQGHLNIKALQVDKALPGLKISGDFEGDAGLVMGGAKLSQLANAPRLEGSFRVTDGAINGIDMTETMRAGKKQLAGGTTHFDVLGGTLSVDGSGQHLKQIKGVAGAMAMSGAADVADGTLSAQMLFDFNKVRAGMGTLPLVISGTVAEPVWRIR